MGIPDSIDEQLVRLLGKNALQNSEALAKQLKLSSATVRRRLRRLIRSGLLHIIGVIDPAKFGLSLAAIIAIDVANDKLELALEELAKKTELRWISTTTGRYDVIALGRFASTDALSEFIQKDLAKLEGIKDTEAFICLDMKRGRYIPIT